jgi:acyl carrier protein
MTRREQLRSDLLGFLDRAEVATGNGEIDTETSLIRSGLIDSLTLFQLFLHVEREVATPLDPTTFDLAEEWDTVNDIVRFIEGRDS